MSPRSTSPLHTFSMFQGFVRQKSTNHTCLNKHFLHTTKSELFSACTSSLLRELTLNRESREGSKNEISSSFKLHYGYFTSLNLPKVSDFFKNFKKMHPSENKKRRKEVFLVCSRHSNGPVISDDDPVRVKFLVREKRYKCGKTCD